ncbi:hypothetical protein R1flu_004333 [Riccia fluitans]|uniref:Uncharacterized protein n=1 Tax=Riccia fluitans TaxID=41844 RepID=A0ABD1YQ02_9MARC
MKEVFDNYVNPTGKADQKPLISGLDTPDFDVDRFLGRVCFETPGDEAMPKELEHSPLQEVTPPEIPMYVVEDIASPPLAGVSEPIEPTPDDVPASEPSQSFPMEPTVHEDHQSPIDVQDGSLVPNDVFEDPHVEESSAWNSQGRELILYTPRDLMTAVELPYSLESRRDNRQEYDDWKSYEDLMKEDVKSITKPRQYIRGDVINMYIKEKFLVQPRGALYGKFFVNTFWFAWVKTLADKLRNNPKDE